VKIFLFFKEFECFQFVWIDKWRLGGAGKSGIPKIQGAFDELSRKRLFFKSIEQFWKKSPIPPPSPYIKKFPIILSFPLLSFKYSFMSLYTTFYSQEKIHKRMNLNKGKKFSQWKNHIHLALFDIFF
jgi:hypothetical protein